MALVTWPWTFGPRNIMARVAPRNVGGSTSLSGAAQVIGSGAMMWRIAYESVPVFFDRVKLWRVLDTRTQGRLNPIVVPVWEGDRIPKVPGLQKTPDEYWRYSGPFGAIKHSDGSRFGDGSGYYQPSNSATLVASLGLGATSATIRSANPIEPGTLFSIGVRLYSITHADPIEGTDDYAVKFIPPARDIASAGDGVEFDRPVCKVRLASDDEMELALTRGRYGFGDVSFVEDVT